MRRRWFGGRAGAGRSVVPREIKTFEKMLEIYCARQPAAAPCADCPQLLEKLRKRLVECPFGDRKPLCSRCSERCLDAPARTMIANIMRYSGPRMLYRYPLLTILHLIDLLRKGPETARPR